MVGLFKKVSLMGIVLVLLLIPVVIAVDPSLPVYLPSSQPAWGTGTDTLIVDLELRPEPVELETKLKDGYWGSFGPHGTGGFRQGSVVLVDVYLIPSLPFNISTTVIQLKSSAQGKLTFLPPSNPVYKVFSGILPDPITFEVDPSGKMITLKYSGKHHLAPMPKSRIYLGSFTAITAGFSNSEVIDSADFELGSQTGSLYLYLEGGNVNSGSYEVVKIGNVKTVYPTACSYDYTSLCQGKCGVMDNGCGALIDCTAIGAWNVNKLYACPTGQLCVNNHCQNPVYSVAVDSPSSFSLLERMADVLGQPGNKPGNAASSANDCRFGAVYDAVKGVCKWEKLSRLNTIIIAVKDWLAAQ